MDNNDVTEVFSKVTANQTNQRELINPNISEQDKQLYYKVSNILEDISITPELKGYYYLREAIIFVYKEPSYECAMMERLFPDIGKKFDESNAKNVHRCIWVAIDKAYKMTWEETLYKYFKKIPARRKLSPSKVIAALVKYINLHQ